MKTKILAIAFAAIAPFAASADEPSYSYADLSYQLGSIDPGGADIDGFRLGFSYGFNDNWFFKFDYSDYSIDPTGDLSDYSIAGGWHNEMFYALLGYEQAESGPADDSGYMVDFGLRSMVSDGVELNGHVGYSDLGTFETFTKYGVGAVWMFGDNMGVSFNYDMWSGDFNDVDSYGVGFRFNFN